jgi:hypothetical protein
VGKRKQSVSVALLSIKSIRVKVFLYFIFKKDLWLLEAGGGHSEGLWETQSVFHGLEA